MSLLYMNSGHGSQSEQVHIEGAWLHSGYLSRHIQKYCRNVLLHVPLVARSTPPKCSCSYRMIVVKVERLT
jgi:hypothetical protein